jgi:cytochrome c-type biogenesis protein CcmH/NrfG
MDLKKIFVSYSRADGGDFADHIQDHYERDGHQVFVDFSDIKPGSDWYESIRNSIAESDIVAVIVTRSALRSTEVEKEVLEAKKQDKTIIPCMYRGISWNDLKWDLNKLQGFQFDNKNSLIRQLDDIIFSDNRSAIPPSFTEEEVGEKPGTLYNRFSSKKSIIIISITIISIIAITGVVIVIVGFPLQTPTPPNGNGIKGSNDKSDVDTLFLSALSSYKIGQYSDAVDSLNKVLQIEPNNVTVQFLKGSSLYEQEKYSDAVDSLNKVLQIEPNNVTAQYLKGSSLYKEAKYSDAVNSFDTVINIDTNNTDALLYKGLSLYNLEKYNDAISEFNRVRLVQPTNINALFYKGLSLYNLERYNEAVAYYDRILEIDPNNINATKEKEIIQQQIQKNQSKI